MRKDPGKALLKIMSDRVDLQVRDVHYTEVGDSGMKWEIRADTARYQKKENLALFEKLAVKLVMKDGKTFVMTGDHGRLNTESKDMEIEGNVGIVSENGDRFKTDRLRYRNADKVIETDGRSRWKIESVRVKRRRNGCFPRGENGCHPVAGPGTFGGRDGSEEVMPARMLMMIVCLGVLIAPLWGPMQFRVSRSRNPGSSGTSRYISFRTVWMPTVIKGWSCFPAMPWRRREQGRFVRIV